MQQSIQARDVAPPPRPSHYVRWNGSRPEVTTRSGPVTGQIDLRDPAPAGVRIVVVDDHTIVLDAFAETLRNVPGFDVVGMISCSKHIIAAVERTRPTVLLMNVGMLDTDCLRIVTEVRRAAPQCGIALIAARPTQALVNRALKAGALSVVPKNARLSHLIVAVRGVAAGCLTVDPALISSEDAAEQTLTPREREVLSLTARGASVKEIATELYLSAGTIRNLSSTAMKKLKGRNRFDAALIAHEQGWL